MSHVEGALSALAARGQAPAPTWTPQAPGGLYALDGGDLLVLGVLGGLLFLAFLLVAVVLVVR